MSRIPLWVKAVGGVGFYAAAAILIKEKLAGPPFDANVELGGKVAIVTGANSGIGYEVAKELAARGAKVYLACRDKDKCAAAREDIYLATDNKNIFCRYCDLSSLDSVKRFARRIHKDEEKVDLLVNNAGVMWGPREVTSDGFETQLGVNHLGHFFLTNLLIDSLKKGAPSRIVNVASTAHFKGKINTQDLNSSNDYSESGAYNQSKLANVLFTRELAKRLDGTDVTVNAVHPGLVDTNIVRNTGTFTTALMLFLRPFVWPFIKNSNQGAQSVLHVALHPDLQHTTGQYFNLREIAEPSKDALNDKLALWLWLTSEKWTKLRETCKELNVQPLTHPWESVSSISAPDSKLKSNTINLDAVNQVSSSSLRGNSMAS
ncbi:Retinol dehydrogenase 13 [Frankliniella fusca]|uniref:Retinol dehydrogenase 13 n=1 Tax=Frankliniella fusca TaxID=407009 RepID=A0AAE1H147_9NEOP|nr:Retinol dehydrogenase 13 [Frankliniella fusca]